MAILKIHLRLFASYRDKVGSSSLDLVFQDKATVGDLVLEMVGRYPDLCHDPDSMVVAVNQEYRDHEYFLSDEDEVALIPPISGGIG